jgi:hypothetical protein
MQASGPPFVSQVVGRFATGLAGNQVPTSDPLHLRTTIPRYDHAKPHSSKCHRSRNQGLDVRTTLLRIRRSVSS